MAIARSLAPLLFLLLSILVATATAARSSVGGGDITVQDACSKTQFPKVCAEALTTKPESEKATPRRLAELFAGIAVDKGSSMGTSLQGKASPDKAVTNCYDSCGDDVEEALAHLNGLIREPTDARFLELKSWLSSTLGGGGAVSTSCEDACKGIPKNADVDAVVANSVEFEKLLRVTLDLITQASGSMATGDIALPPSDAAAPSSYGAAAPPLVGDAASSSSSAEAPAPAAEGSSSSAAAAPQYGGAASGPSADSPAASADAPSSGGAASSAPAASGPSGADAPSGGDNALSPDDGASGDDGSDDSDDNQP